MDLATILINVVFPSLVTAALLLIAWRPWNRSARPARWQFVLSAAALSVPWIIAAGNRGNSDFHPSLWSFKPWNLADPARWFLDFAIAVAVISILLALISPKPTLADSPIRPFSRSSLFAVLNFALTVILGALILWLLNRIILARVPLDDATDAEILDLATKQSSIRISLIAVPLIAATWSLIADRLTARGKSVLVPATLSLVALASTLIIFMCGSATLMLLMAALAAMMIATTVMAFLSKPAIFPAGHTASFFLIWSTILIFTRYNQAQMLPDYFWLLMLTPAGLLAALHPVVWSLCPIRRFLAIAAVTLVPPALILWQLYPSWQQKMAGATG